MSGIVIRLEPPNKERGFAKLTGMLCRIDEAPFPGIDRAAGRLPPLAAFRGRPGDKIPVEREGRRLADWLLKDPAIRAVLKRVRELERPPSIPIRLLVQDDASHCLPWETLFMDTFLALEPFSPVTRIPRGAPAEARDPVKPLAQHLRITAVLSARGVDGVKQWEAIRDAVGKARKRGLAIKLSIISGDGQVIAAVQEAEHTDALLQLLPVPGPDAPVPLLELIRSTQPHVLHFFAHGDINADRTQRILVATKSDVNTDSAILNAKEVGDMAAEVGVWCVALVICGGADATAGVFTHAEEIVNRGVPAAIAMRREIEKADADRFTQSWFPTALEAIADAVLPPSEVAERRPVQWADTLTRARRELRDRDRDRTASASDVWATPVLYVLPGSFLVEVPPGSHTAVPEPAIDPEDAEARPIEIDEMAAQTRLSAESEVEALIASLPVGTPRAVIDLLRGTARGEALP